MAGNQFGGGGGKFQTAQPGLERQVFQLGKGPTLGGSPIRGEGNVPVAGMAPEVIYASIGKGEQGVRGASPIRVVGGTSPFGPQMGAPGGGGSFQPAPQPSYPPQPIQAQQHASLGANEEVHTLVAKLEGPSGRQYEAVYEVVVGERGCKVLGVSERPTR